MLSIITTSLAGLLSFGAFIPYGFDVYRGRVQPARSTRIMFTLLMTLVLLQQISLGASWTLAVTIGELGGAIGLLALSIRRGHAGLSRTDIACYLLLASDVIVWIATQNPLIALYLSVAADVIAFYPTLHKTWRHPDSETALFYGLGAVAPLVNLIGVPNLTFALALYPLALAVENSIEVALIYRVKLSTLY